MTAPEERGWARPLVAILAMMAVVVVVVLARGLYRAEPLEPGNPQPAGSRAVVSVLSDDLGRDVAVERAVLDAAAGLRDGRSVVVTDPTLLSAEQLAELRTAQDASGGLLVLVQPGFQQLRELAPDVLARGTVDETGTVAEAGCGGAAASLPGLRPDLTGGASALSAGAGSDAEDADPAQLYRPVPGSAAVGCFAVDDSYAVVADGTRPTVVLGSPRPLMNAEAADHGNAAFTLNLLGGEDLVWYLPSTTDPLAAESAGPMDVIPSAALHGGIWLVVVALVVVAWGAGRRLGPVVAENLPVAVRARETTLGRAELYRRAGARGRAADVLRAGTASRLAPRAGVAPHASREELVAALVERSGIARDRLRDVLFARPVASDTDLVTLSQDLTALEKELAPHVT